jgi:hypothetical protein
MVVVGTDIHPKTMALTVSYSLGFVWGRENCPRDQTHSKFLTHYKNTLWFLLQLIIGPVKFHILVVEHQITQLTSSRTLLGNKNYNSET